MRKFLSNFLLSIFVIVFAFPVSTFAQYSWTPPAGAPTVNNTPSPINVSGLEQWKTGLLKVGQTEPLSPSGTMFSTSGSVIFDIPTGFSGSGSQNFTSFLPNASFVGNSLFRVGDQDGDGGSPRINLNGQLRYIPRNSNGSPTANQQPSAGKVLRALDDTGLIGWGDATGLPQGGNNGDILIWDSATNEWISGPNQGGLPTGSSWSTLSWNPIAPGGPEWQSNTVLTVNTQSKEIKSDPTSNTIDFTTNIDEDSYLTLRSPFTRIYSNELSIPLYIPESCLPNCPDPTGKILTALDASGTVNWVNPSDLGLEGGAGGCALPASAGQTCWYDGTGWQATDQIKHDNYSPTGFPPFTARTSISNPLIDIGTQSSGITRHYSPSVFFGTDVGGQNIRFNSSTIQFKGPANNSPLEPGIGRIPFSTDANGTFKWNQNLTYTTSVNPANIGVGQLRLRNPSNIPGASSSISTFFNEGLTILEGSTYMYDNIYADADFRISAAGDLYLDGPDAPSILSGGSGLIPLCWNQNTNKVMRCTSTTTGGPIGPGDPNVLGSIVTRTFYAGNHELEFNSSGPVNIKYCGGGGGGAGGGVGNISGQNNGPGGGGGGGGSKGQCHETVINVNAGQTLSMNVGNRGLGGSGTTRIYNWSVSSGVVAYYPGSNGGGGGVTSVSLDGNAIGPVANQGSGGTMGSDAVDTVGGGGNGAFSSNWWNNGSSGRPSTDTMNNPSPPPSIITNDCVSCGGGGGTGQRNTNDTQTTQISAPASSGRGGGGLSGPTTADGTLVNNSYIGSSNYLKRYGGDGASGVPSDGGGGGGGSYGFPSSWLENSPSVDELGSVTARPEMRGGRGGDGGSGYVQISYNSSSPTSTSNAIVFQNPGTGQTFNISSSTVTNSATKIIMEVWGGGGGGGPVTFSNQNLSYAAGGGGGGAYRRVEWNLPQDVMNCLMNTANVCRTLSISVGSGGALGISNGSPGPTVPGENGQSSSVESPLGFASTTPPNASSTITANGGSAGGISSPSNPATNPQTATNGAAGTGGTAPQPGGTAGLAGQSGNLGGIGGQAINGAFGAGGNGSKYQWVGGFGTPTPGTSGGNGGVRISWE